jgi:hypothetical protein
MAGRTIGSIVPAATVGGCYCLSRPRATTACLGSTPRVMVKALMAARWLRTVHRVYDMVDLTIWVAVYCTLLTTH